jgi:hypothetical protein
MRKKAIITLFLGSVLTAMAEDYTYLTIESADGSKASLTAVGLQIKFKDGNLVATNGTESTTIALSALSAMRFTATDESGTAGITSNVTDDDFSINDADVIYDLQGRRIASNQIKKGIYIIQKDNQTKKIQVK